MNPTEENDGLDADDKRRLRAIAGFLDLSLPEEAIREYEALSPCALRTKKACRWGLWIGQELKRWDLVALCALRLLRLEPGCGSWVLKWNKGVAQPGVPQTLLRTFERLVLANEHPPDCQWASLVCTSEILLCVSGAALLGRTATARRYLRCAMALSSSSLAVARARPELAVVVKAFAASFRA